MMQWQGRVIDAHAHVVRALCGFNGLGEMYPLGQGRVRWATGEEAVILPDGKDCWTPEDLISLMDQNQVERAVLMQGSYLGFCNEYAAQAQQTYPDRLSAMGCLDPYAKHAPRILRHLIEELGMKGIKIEMGADVGLCSYHPEFRINAPCMAPIFSYAQQRDFPIAIDMSPAGQPHLQVEELADMLERYPDTRVVVEHLFYPSAGDEEILKRAMERLKRFENLMFSTAAMPNAVPSDVYPFATVQGLLKIARDIVGAKRLMWGTDVPTTLLHCSYEAQKNYILEGGVFHNEELQNIYYGNAKRFYGLA